MSTVALVELDRALYEEVEVPVPTIVARLPALEQRLAIRTLASSRLDNTNSTGTFPKGGRTPVGVYALFATWGGISREDVSPLDLYATFA